MNYVSIFLVLDLSIKNLSVISGKIVSNYEIIRGGSGTAATFKMERFVIIDNGFQPLTIIKKRSILNVAAALDPPLIIFSYLSSAK